MSDVATFGDSIVRIDRSGAGPPWPLLVWNHDTLAWEPISAIAPAITLLYDSTAPSGGATDFTYNPIDTNYASLLINASLRLTVTATSSNVRLQFNGDTAANYKIQDFFAYSGASAADTTFTAQTAAFLGNATLSDAPANDFAHIEARILNYQNPHMNKILYSKNVYTYDSSGDMILIDFYSQWQSAAPITSLRIAPLTGDFAEHSRVSIFGLLHGA